MSSATMRPTPLREMVGAYVKGVIYGDTGVGKSVFCGSSRYLRTLIFDVDMGVDSVRAWPQTNLDTTHRVECPTWKDFEAWYDWLVTHIGEYDLAVIDTASELQRLLLSEIVSRKRKIIADTQDWGVLLLMMEELCRKVRALPINVLFVTHEKYGEDPETKQWVFRPSFQGQFGDSYGKHFGLIARLQLFDQEVKEGDKVSRVTHRFLNCQRDQSITAKDRSNSLAKYEPVDIDVVLGKYLTAIRRQGGTIQDA